MDNTGMPQVHLPTVINRRLNLLPRGKQTRIWLGLLDLLIRQEVFLRGLPDSRTIEQPAFARASAWWHPLRELQACRAEGAFDGTGKLRCKMQRRSCAEAPTLTAPDKRR